MAPERWRTACSFERHHSRLNLLHGSHFYAVLAAIQDLLSRGVVYMRRSLLLRYDVAEGQRRPLQIDAEGLLFFDGLTLVFLKRTFLLSRTLTAMFLAHLLPLPRRRA